MQKHSKTLVANSSAKLLIFLHICKKVWFKNDFSEIAHSEYVRVFFEKG